LPGITALLPFRRCVLGRAGLVGGVVAESLVVLAQAFRAALVSFQPELHSGEDCAAVAEELALVEKLSAVIRVDAALRVKECGTHRERGFGDVADWMARATGSTAGSAKAALETAAALESQPEAKAALAAGELSFAQARELVKTEAAVPGSTAGLLDVAKTESLRTLKERARDRRVRAIDPEELHARQHAAMSHRTWINALGNVAYAGELSPELGIPFKNVLDAETDRLWLKAYNDAKEDGDADPKRLDRAALAAQAFVRMVENGGGKGKANRADLVIVCDLQAWRRGHAHEGEPCHIIGGGPIPVSLAKELGRDAFLKAVLHTGTELHTIAHFGRRYPAVLRTAFDLGAPPEFDGNVCAAPGCDRTYRLQDDHIDPVANDGVTSYANHQPLYPQDHRSKTERDRKAGLLRGGNKPRGPDPQRAAPNRDQSRPRLL
jgi:uncharacterized protein DUF222/HNH endonuclease